ncbi:MAG: ABC transporter substrate-binding protein [Sporichthyaceae bacterium]
MARAFPAARALALVAAAGLVLAACSDDDEVTAPPTTTQPTSAAGAGNGVLKLGTLLPETGSLAILGPPEIAAVKLAVADINAAGGVLGKPVELQLADSGDTTTDVASQSVDRLIDGGVDAIVGAASSSVTLTVIDKITGSGVLQISPANTSTTLTSYADKGLYFRTAPSDVYQGRVVGETALDDGAETLGILALQDAYGTSLAEQASKAFTDGGGEVVATEIYNPTASEYSAEVGKVLAEDPDALAVIGFDETAKILDELVEAKFLPLADNKKIYFVDGNMSNVNYLKRPKGEIAGVKGTVPGAAPSDEFQERLLEIDPALKDFSYAGEAYDAVNLVALSAEAAGSDAGTSIAAKMQETSSGGEKCGTFTECLALLKAGTDIDYDGQAGPVEFDDEGNPSNAAMGVYQYGNDNTFKLLKTVSGAIDGSTPSTSVDANGATSAPKPSAEPTDEASAEPTEESTSSSSSSSSSVDEEETETASPEATSTP